MPGRVCSLCKTWKPADSFSKHAGRPDGLYSWCKECANARHRSLKFEPDPAMTEKLCASCREIKAVGEFYPWKWAKDGYSSSCKACRVNSKRMSQYGIPSGWYERTYEEQGGRCAICKKEKAVLAIDHDHSCCPDHSSCGLCIRALLCSKCNLGLGNFDDDPQLLADAIAYLAAHELWKGGDWV